MKLRQDESGRILSRSIIGGPDLFKQKEIDIQQQLLEKINKSKKRVFSLLDYEKRKNLHIATSKPPFNRRISIADP